MLGTIGASLNTPELKEITWRSEMKKRCVLMLLLYWSTRLTSRCRPLEDIDPRMSFATFAKRAGILTVEKEAVKEES